MTDFWKPHRVSALRKLWEQGRTISEIARILGGECTRNMVVGKARRLNLPSRPSPILRKTAKIIEVNFRRCCEYPIGHVGEPTFHFCGDRKRPGSAYCEAHHALCYRKAAK